MPNVSRRIEEDRGAEQRQVDAGFHLLRAQVVPIRPKPMRDDTGRPVTL